jgi:RNA recognition motif-containing protein
MSQEAPPPSKPIRYDTTLTEGKCFLGGLDTGTTKQSLEDYCAPWGEVVDSVVMEGRGFGFVTFADGSAANSFIAHEGGHTIDGKSIEVRVRAALLGFLPDRNACGSLRVARCVRSPRAGELASNPHNAALSLLGFLPDRNACGGLWVARCVRSPRAWELASNPHNARTPTYPAACPPELIT